MIDLTRIKKAKIENNFTILRNEILRDSRLSYKARGLLACMLSMSDNWVFYVSDLVNRSSKDGKASVNAGLKELSNCGYLVREQQRTKDGKFSNTDWMLYDTPQGIFSVEPLTDFPSAEKPSAEKPSTENQPLRSNNYKNTNYKKNKYKNNQSIKENNWFNEEAFKHQINFEELKEKDDDGSIIYIISILFEVMKQSEGTYKINKVTRECSEVQAVFTKATSTHIENVAKDVSSSNSEIKNKRNYIISALFNEIKSNHLSKKTTSRKITKRVETLPYWAVDGYEFKEEVMTDERRKELEDLKLEALKKIREKSNPTEREGIESGI